MEQTRARDAVEEGVGGLPSLAEIKPGKRLDAIPGFKEAAESVSRGLHNLVLKGGHPTRRLADLLHGTWLGHPLHSVLTDVTIGAWMFGSLMDLLSLSGRSPGTRRAADRLIAIGTVSAVPTALSGIADFSTIPRGALTTGATHGLLNTLTLALYGLSLWGRRSGRRPAATVLSGMACGLLLISGWLGGELAYRYRVGVNRARDAKKPKTWVAVMDSDDLRNEKPRRIDYDERPVLLYRYDGQIYAMGAVCAHEEGPLEEGKFDGCLVECPFHQSVYDLRNGKVVHGPATYAIPSYETRVHNGKIEIRLRKES
jgi:nitrite reductase/ring-hydroxylating ferredoxin subunit